MAEVEDKPARQSAVLVVEDEALLRMSIAAELEDQGLFLFEAANADEAIDAIERNPDIRLVFTDIDMPGKMDGLRLARFVRDRWPPIMIIVTSGHHLPEASQLPDNTPFMRKPYAFDDVISAVRGPIG
jgi:CheY-like chemotaxis protein